MARTKRKRLGSWWKNSLYSDGTVKFEDFDSCNRDMPPNHWDHNRRFKDHYREFRRNRYKQHLQKLIKDFDNTPLAPSVEKRIRKLWWWFN